MAYLPDYKYDIYVSYAHGPARGRQGDDLLSSWTEQLVNDLRCHIGVFLGTKDPARTLEIWMDRDFKANQGFTETLKKQIEGSALLLVIMSHFYVDSPWCTDELAWFASLSGLSTPSDRIFVVRAFQTDHARWPAALRDSRGNVLAGMSFHKPPKLGEFGEPHGWPVPRPEDLEYQELVSKVAQQIASQLQKIGLIERPHLSKKTGPNAAPEIFISYDRADAARVAPLTTALRNCGWSVFWDRGIPAGQTWDTFIGQALDRSNCVLVVWSESSISSPWVLEEAHEGLRRGILVPVLLDDVRMPMGFRRIQAADLCSWAASGSLEVLDSLFDDIRHIVGKSS